MIMLKLLFLFAFTLLQLTEKICFVQHRCSKVILLIQQLVYVYAYSIRLMMLCDYKFLYELYLK